MSKKLQLKALELTYLSTTLYTRNFISETLNYCHHWQNATVFLTKKTKCVNMWKKHRNGNIFFSFISVSNKQMKPKWLTNYMPL